MRITCDIRLLHDSPLRTGVHTVDKKFAHCGPIIEVSKILRPSRMLLRSTSSSDFCIP